MDRKLFCQVQKTTFSSYAPSEYELGVSFEVLICGPRPPPHSTTYVNTVHIRSFTAGSTLVVEWLEHTT